MSEQGFVHEFDDKETLSTHIVAYDGDAPVGTCRYYPLPDGEGEVFAVGRVAVGKSHRKSGLGSALVAAAELEIRLAGGKEIRISAQVRASAFYGKLGFVPYGVSRGACAAHRNEKNLAVIPQTKTPAPAGVFLR